MGRRANTIWALVVLSVGAAFVASPVAAAPNTDPGTYPVSQLPMLAQQYAPGAAVPTKLPAGIAQFRFGPGRLNGYPQRAKYEIEFEKNPSSLLGFKLDVFSGSRVAAVTRAVAAYLKRGGWVVTTSPFMAGRYKGVVESQRNGGNAFQMHTWASGGSTYVVTTYVRYAGRPQNPWSKKAVIASFKIPSP
jgi:hypothetical protein